MLLSRLNTEAVQQYRKVIYDNWERHCRKRGFDIKAANAGKLRGNPSE